LNYYVEAFMFGLFVTRKHFGQLKRTNEALARENAVLRAGSELEKANVAQLQREKEALVKENADLRRAKSELENRQSITDPLGIFKKPLSLADLIDKATASSHNTPTSYRSGGPSDAAMSSGR
jgi:hypothetical protein